MCRKRLANGTSYLNKVEMFIERTIWNELTDNGKSVSSRKQLFLAMPNGNGLFSNAKKF